MLRSRPLLTLLWLLALLNLGLSTWWQQDELVVISAILLGLAGLALGGRWRFTALLLYPVAFTVSRWAVSQQGFSWDGGLTFLLTMLALVWIGWRERGFHSELEWQRNISAALSVGSERLNEARDAEGIIRAGVGILNQLKVAPNIGFVAYKQGTPMLLGASGAFESFLERPIHPSRNDSRSVQADHWVAEEVLSLLHREDRHKYLVAPVYGRNEAHLGVLLLARPTDKAFNAQEEEIIDSFSRLLGAQLGQWQAIRDLRDSNELTLRSLGAALERRDDETGGHTQRVVNTSVRLARRLGWDEDKVKALRWGAYLHDLGKLAIPDSILHKPGPLTPEERQIIRSHASIGYDMLQDLHFLPAETMDLVRYHHERWDGTGYPAGLRGKDIPETARIFTIVDVFDALTNSRPYKDAWPREKAAQEIRNGAGKNFDPQYVDAFLSMINERDEAKLVS